MEKEVLVNGAISMITLGELFYGACKSTNKTKSLKLISNFLDDFSIRILNLSGIIVHIFAEDKANLEVKGKRLEDFDLLIAATAKAHSLILLTKNIKHFKRISKLKLA